MRTVRKDTTTEAEAGAPPSAAHNPWVVSVLVALLCLIWGSTWLVIRVGLEDLPPFTGATARFAIAAVVMAIVAPRIARVEGGVPPGLGLVLVTGLGQFTISYAIVYWTEQSLPSGLVSVLWSVFPLLVAGLGAAVLPEERLRARQWIGFVLGFAGIVLLFSTDVREIGPEAIPAGLVLLCSPVVVALATVYLKRYGRGVSSALLNRSALAVGAAGLLVCALVSEDVLQATWSAKAWASVLYLALVGTSLAFGVYLWLMRWVAAFRLSLIAYVSPLIALTLGATLGDEPVGATTLLGTAVVLGGVACAALPTRRRS